MHAEAKSCSFLGNEQLIKIPFFQRAYVWDIENWKDLIEDLINSRKSHFLGSLILKQRTPITGEPREVTVIDGQQRLTTLSVLLKALYDSFSKELKQNCERDLRNILFYKKYPTDKEYFIKIEHSHNDIETYKAVILSEIDGQPAIDLTDNPNSNKILQCYRFFRKELDKQSERERAQLFNGILYPENKMMVIIDLTDAENEQAIFDTINSAGVRLGCADIIKNALFQKAIQVYGNQKKVIELYDKTWKKVFLEDENITKYWETERLTGRLRRDNIEILLHCIAVIKGFYDPDRDTLSDLSDVYKSQIASIDTIEEINAFVNDIVDYAAIYKNKIVPIDNSTLMSFEDKFIRLLHVLEVLQVSTFHPFILYVLKKYENDDQKQLKILGDLEQMILIRMISSQETKSYNKFCKKFIADENAILKEIGNNPAELVSAGLRHIPNKYATLLLFWVELSRRHKDKKYDTKKLTYSYTLEHIMPQKWEDYWKELPKKKKTDDTIMNVDESKKDRFEKIYWIGNMTLLSGSLNSALKNYMFTTKIIGEGRKKGIKSYADLSITKDDIVLKYETGDVTWDENKIVARTGMIEEEINEIWNFKNTSSI